jgi:hypothetical protein
VLARVGAKSLHGVWTERTVERDWDLRLVPFQELPPEAGFDCEVGEIVAGPKWSGLRHALNEWDGWREYDYVWLPDDDILTRQDTIDRMFDAARGAGLDLFAPALAESSYYAHFITMENRSFYGRRTGFVEIMVPGFSTAALEELLPTLDLSVTGWGWGLDSLWPKLLDYRNVGIIDGTPVLHTRPVGQMRDPLLGEQVLAESDKILADNDCGQMHVTFGAFDADLQPLDLTEEELLAEILRGSEYLIERDPRVRDWIIDFQRTGMPCPDYPVAGTPEARPPDAVMAAAAPRPGLR